LWSSRSVGYSLVPPEALLLPADAPPVAQVAIVSPPDESQFRNPDAIPLEVRATHPAGKIAAIDFMTGNQVIGSVTSEPYRFEWKNPPAGQYRLKARATDEKGISAYSDPIEISVSDAGENHSL